MSESHTALVAYLGLATLVISNLAISGPLLEGWHLSHMHVKYIQGKCVIFCLSIFLFLYVWCLVCYLCWLSKVSEAGEHPSLLLLSGQKLSGNCNYCGVYFRIGCYVMDLHKKELQDPSQKDLPQFLQVCLICYRPSSTVKFPSVFLSAWSACIILASTTQKLL